MDCYQGIHRAFGFRVRNENGSSLLEFAIAHELVIVDSYFLKRDDNLITFRSGGHTTQIDYLLIRDRDIRCRFFQKQHVLHNIDSYTKNTLAEFERIKSRRKGVSLKFSQARGRWGTKWT